MTDTRTDREAAQAQFFADRDRPTGGGSPSIAELVGAFSSRGGPDVRPYESRAGIGWRCATCGSTWSGARVQHTAEECRRVAALPAVDVSYHEHDMSEHRLSDCPYGCKVFRCECGDEELRHMASYGCPAGHDQAGEKA